MTESNYPSHAERLMKVEVELRGLKESFHELKEDLDNKFDLVFNKFDQYVRLERYKVVELAVFGVISLMTTAVILALVALVLKSSP